MRVDDVVFDDGMQATREVVEHRGASVIIPLLDDNRVLLVRQYRYAIGKELLEIPAGTCDDEEPPEICAKRELQEETGYTCDELKKILECYVAPGYSTEKIHFYLARKLRKTAQAPDEDERITVEPTSITEGLSKIRNGEISDAKTICAFFRMLDFVQDHPPL
ncbi:MAG TPA: NUDIX hydrolase [Methylomirabilota bacterium]|nr:NUDIX hydrolase [Methylomirabilota bacterium]